MDDILFCSTLKVVYVVLSMKKSQVRALEGGHICAYCHVQISFQW
jgi:hypothetical protein